MSKDISKYIKSCHKCQAIKRLRTPIIMAETPKKSCGAVHVDSIGPCPKSLTGNVYAVTLICGLTKSLVTIRIRQKSAKTIAKAIFEHFVQLLWTNKDIHFGHGNRV